ncbi:Asp23/Gls24 family envelope stress response protein [Schnuerera sp. xch1]|uniref:Asp23/Gls24 family envelope stress response protein n=1 Tax=Schnuerera sp. xch1 TaxID=2874283 RepID=UPI001CC16280|nr:Asp23/Gls24 family envelope stress response protein [Schnuerera sp. xch1]MBZ2173917.1 Asp23/Gls24 family envelope stress response protein [Schnuerera sp. xch1]
MPGRSKNQYGYIDIDDNVIATISGLSAMESYGIVGMASKNATDGFFELLKRDNLSKGVKIYTEKDEIIINLHVILQYGIKISVVAENIIEKVKFNVENLTGLKIKKVNVYVQGIRVEK